MLEIGINLLSVLANVWATNRSGKVLVAVVVSLTGACALFGLLVGAHAAIRGLNPAAPGIPVLPEVVGHDVFGWSAGFVAVLLIVLWIAVVLIAVRSPRAPLLRFARMEPAIESVFPSSGGPPLDSIRLWRVALQNATVRSQAPRVQVRLEELLPQVQDIQMALHEKDDHTCRQERDVPHGVLLWLDTLAKSQKQDSDTLYAFRSDLPRQEGAPCGYIYQFPSDRARIILQALRSQDALRVKLVAAGDSPASAAEQWCRFWLSPDGVFEASFCDPPS